MFSKKWLRLTMLLMLMFGSILTFNLTQAQVLPVFRIGVLDEADGALTRGAQLAVQQINNAGGVVGADDTLFQLQLVIQSPNDLDFALANLDQADVIAIIGPEDSSTALGNSSNLTSLGVPVLTTATDDTLIVNDSTNLIMRIRAQEALIGRALADYLVNDLNAATLATVQLDLESTVGVVGFTRASSQLGLAPNAEYLLSEDNTLQRIVLDIIATQPQFVAAYGAPDQVAELYTSLREGDWAGRFIYNNASVPDFRDNVQEELLEGIIGANTWSATLGDETSQNYTFDYIRAFGDVPTALSASAYDGIGLIQDAIGQAGTLQNNLLGLVSYDGVQGNLASPTTPDAEFSNNVVVTNMSEFGAPFVVARFAGNQRIELENPTFVEVTPTATQPLATATPDGVFLIVTRAVQNVRTGPGLNYDILGQLQEGDTAEVIGATIDFGWVAINFRGTTGWLSRGILDLVGDTTTVPVLAAPPTPTPPPATATPIPPPVADIVIVTASPNRITIGQPFNINAVVRNQGSVPAGQFAVAASFQPGDVYSAQILSGLGAGAETTITLSGTLTGGTGVYNVGIIADLNNQISEGTNGEANNNAYVLTYVADAPLLMSAPATGTTTLNETDVLTLDGGTNDIQWGGGAIQPLGATELVQLNGFANFANVHRDAVANSALQNAGVLNITPGMLIGVRTDGGLYHGVIQVVSATPGGQLTINYRIYNN